MKISDEIIVTIDGIDHQGRGIAHLQDKTVFVFDALVGETVKIKILKVKKKIAEAISLEILEKSKDRVESPCPYFKKCGGCDLLHMTYEKQLEYKENKIKEIIKKFAGIENVVSAIIPNEQVFEYRNKVVFWVNKKIGFYQKKSDYIIDIEKCLLVSQKVNSILSILKNKMDTYFINQIMIRESCNLNDIIIVLDVTDKFNKQQIPIDELKQTSILMKRNHEYEVVSGNDYLMEKVGEYIFKISPDSFFQVNTKQMEKLYQTVLDYSGLTGNENILDLYCGTGTIGIFLSSKAKAVLGIEINEQAIRDANWNKKQNHISNIEFICGDTGTILKKNTFQPDVIVVDPPRDGLDENAITEIQNLSVPKIIYVSCDPVTLARDIKRLEKEYEVVRIIPVDMFSNTFHVECVCVLNRR